MAEVVRVFILPARTSVGVGEPEKLRDRKGGNPTLCKGAKDGTPANAQKTIRVYAAEKELTCERKVLPWPVWRLEAQPLDLY